MSDEIEDDDNLNDDEQLDSQENDGQEEQEEQDNHELPHASEGMDRGDITSGDNGEKITAVGGLYQDWFLDYASYVILERAVPNLADGLKPVQRRILHSMKEMDDGRYNKVANII